MARERLDLHTILLGITPNVYFQPPSNVRMRYPCIVYSRDDVRNDFADNLPYKTYKRYQVTIIDRDPDSELPDKVGALPLTAYDRFFASDDLNHDVYTLYF